MPADKKRSFPLVSPQKCEKNCMNTTAQCSFFFFLYKVFLCFILFFIHTYLISIFEEKQKTCKFFDKKKLFKINSYICRI